MKKELIRGNYGYDIPFLSNLTGNERQIVIICHGFGSSKDGSTAKLISTELPKHGIGTVCFDFPAHGESPVDGELLRVEHCTGDLAVVEAHVQKQCPDAEIAYFSSSFGAYINLVYLATRTHAGRKSFLRCAAVDMAGIIRRGTTPPLRAQLESDGYVVLDYDYVRPLRITREFLADLDAFNVFELYRPGTAELAMIHGTADRTAPIGDARCFATLAGAQFCPVEGAGHSFQGPGCMELVADEAIRFFVAPPGGEPFQIRQMAGQELAEALQLAWEVFMSFEAPDYCEEGIRNFRRFLDNEELTGALTLYGAFDGETLIGIAATRNGGNHLSLFFVNSLYHRRGVGRRLFEAVLQHSTGERITVHSSPYAAQIYRRLGFSDIGREQMESGIRFIPMEYHKASSHT